MRKHLFLLPISVLLFLVCSCEKDNELNPTPQFVDLGLTVNWATFNVGASQPQEYGDFYAWGETDAKDRFYWATYKYNVGEYDEDNLSSLTKYCPKSGFGYNGYTDTPSLLDLSDDVAHAKWGGNWRLPTSNEFKELRDSCNWEWTTLNGVKGFKVTSKVAGFTEQSIFLPAAGYKSGSKIFNSCPTVNYWTSSLYAKWPYFSYCITYHFDDEEQKTEEDIYNAIYIGNSGRYIGRPIRPVCTK